MVHTYCRKPLFSVHSYTSHCAIVPTILDKYVTQHISSNHNMSSRQYTEHQHCTGDKCTSYMTCTAFPFHLKVILCNTTRSEHCSQLAHNPILTWNMFHHTRRFLLSQNQIFLPFHNNKKAGEIHYIYPFPIFDQHISSLQGNRTTFRCCKMSETPHLSPFSYATFLEADLHILFVLAHHMECTFDRDKIVWADMWPDPSSSVSTLQSFIQITLFLRIHVIFDFKFYIPFTTYTSVVDILRTFPLFHAQIFVT